MTTASIASIITSGFLFLMLFVHGNNYDRSRERRIEPVISLGAAVTQVGACWAAAVFLAEIFG